jgi:hypothetical protein
MEEIEEMEADPDLYVYDQGYYLKKPEKGALNYERKYFSDAYAYEAK